MSGQVINLSLAAAAKRRKASAAMAFPHDACTRAEKAPAVARSPLPSAASPGNLATFPCRPATARVQRVSHGDQRVQRPLPFFSLRFRPVFVERAAVILGCAGALLVLGIRLAGGA